MAEVLTAAQAAERVHTVDTVGMALGPGQPPALLRAMGERDDWEELKLAGALLAVGTELFTRPGVHYLSGFFGPFERALRDIGANISFTPADFRRMTPLLELMPPRVMLGVAAPPDADGWCSLSLHEGATSAAMREAARDPDRLLVVEAAAGFPRTRGLPPDHPHALHVDEIDILVHSDDRPLALPGSDAQPTDVDRAIAEHAVAFIEEGATLQTGIGSIPSTIATILAERETGGYGLHTEMFTDGCMRLHQAGKVVNRKGIYDGVSVTTFSFGSDELYGWLDGNDEVAFLPVGVVNAPEVIARNRKMVTINGAMAVDIHGQVIADTIEGTQFSGIGGSEDFIAGPGLSIAQRSLICMPATATVKGEVRSRIVSWFAPGAVVTVPRHQVDVVITEYGAAELEGRTVHQRGLALAEIAHPDFREELREAAARASKGHSPVI